jgi:HPt (histidine-containing phosphotransfer) domain-containing protein
VTDVPARKRGAPIDLERAVHEFDADREFLRELVRGFLKNVGEQVETIRAAMEKGDSEAVCREAHSIRGGAANICAESLSLAAWKLEVAGKSGSLDNGREMLGELQHEFGRLEGYVRDEFDGSGD